MIFLILGLLMIIIAYYLLIRGYLFKIILSIFGCFGLYYFLIANVPSTLEIAVTLIGFNLSYAVVIPLLILIGAMGTERI